MKTTQLIIMGMALIAIASTALAAETKPKKSATKSKSTPSGSKYKEPPIRAGAEITVLSLDAKTRTLIVKINSEPGVGPNIATPEALVEAVGIADTGDKKNYLDNPKRFVGSVYTLQKDLPLVSESMPAKSGH